MLSTSCIPQFPTTVVLTSDSWHKGCSILPSATAVSRCIQQGSGQRVIFPG